MKASPMQKCKEMKGNESEVAGYFVADNQALREIPRRLKKNSTIRLIRCLPF